MGDEKWILYNNVKWKRLWSKWNEPTQITPKASCHPNKVMLWTWRNWKGVLYYERLLKSQMMNSNKYCFQLNQLKAVLNEKCTQLVNRKYIIFLRVTQDLRFLWWPGKNIINSLAGKFWFIHCIHQALHLQISIYFGLYKILSMKKTSIHWRTVKGTWNNSLLKNTKKIWKDEVAWKIA